MENIFYNHYETPEGWIWRAMNRAGDLVGFNIGYCKSEEQCLEEFDEMMKNRSWTKTGIVNPRGLPLYEPSQKIL